MSEDTEKIDKKPSDLELEIAKIDLEIKKAQERYDKAKAAFENLNKKKIFTLKELKHFKEQEMIKKKKEFEEEKSQIGERTAKKLKEAEEMRKYAETLENPQEKNNKLSEASNLETEALKREIYVREIISREEEEKLENLLAQREIDKKNLNMRKCQKDRLNGDSEKDYVDLCNKVHDLEIKIKDLDSNIVATKEKIEDNSSKLIDAVKKLKKY